MAEVGGGDGALGGGGATIMVCGVGGTLAGRGMPDGVGAYEISPLGGWGVVGSET